MNENFYHEHNLVDPRVADASRPFGIRVSLPGTDPFTRLVGTDWTKEHWYRSEAERDEAFENMRNRHGYYRIGDDVSLIFEKISADR
ncbi:MAG: hypothetical protein AAFX58_11005 [Pseudomonadota bacterium]